MTQLRRLVADRTGAAAAEMALVVPIFVALIFGTFELGHFFMSEHIVQKSVRDAARYAARLPITSYPGCTSVDTAAATSIQNVAQTGDPDGDSNNDGQPDQRLQGWTDDAMTTISVACNNTGTYKGIYEDFPAGAPVVTVVASVPYPTMFAKLGLGTATADKCGTDPANDSWVCLRLGARSQSAVFGA
jgi:Flp pilus assembly protein TadG